MWHSNSVANHLQYSLYPKQGPEVTLIVPDQSSFKFKKSFLDRGTKFIVLVIA